MRLSFSHKGKQFFFITLGLEGRPEVLSRLVDEHHRPTLTRCGETVKAALVAFHEVFEAVGVSDFVIMPDHLHFLMIVDYDRAPSFNPLFASFVFMRAVEAGWARLPNGRGQAPEPPENAGNGQAPEPPGTAGNGVVPSPVEMAMLLRESLRAEREIAVGLARLQGEGLSREAALAKLGVDSTGGSRAFDQSVAAGVRGRAPVRSVPRFERRAYIELSFDSRQLKTIRRYIRLNVARKLWKTSHPDRFVRFANIGHRVLDRSRRWDAMGNLTLLGSPFLFHVRLTLKKTVAEHEAAIAETVEKARRGYIPVSGFISPGEVEALRRLKAEPRARFVKMLPFSLPPRYDPSAEDSRELAADRLLILSGFTNTPNIPAVEMRRALAASREFRRNCLEMNDLAAAVCERALEKV